MSKSLRNTQVLLFCGAALSLCAGLTGAEAKSGFKVLYAFANSPDGSYPMAPLFTGGDGNLYGTTAVGGDDAGDGTVFRITPKGSEKVLYSFAGTPDGSDPQGGPIADSQGNLYGTTYLGGANSSGTVYELSAAGKETKLYDFCSKNNCSDGQDPNTTLIMDGDGNMYGTTTTGGSQEGAGVIFRITTGGKYSVLHAFNGKADGAQPEGRLWLDASGNLYGTTSAAGKHSYGTVFELASDGTYSVLYAFQGKKDGAGPQGGVIADSAGNLYGTTNSAGAKGFGTVYEITADHAFKLLHAFKGGKDGANPYGELVGDGHGNLYGTANAGGKGGQGAVFKVTTTGSESILHAFEASDGAYPLTGLTLVSQNGVTVLYGTTSTGAGGDGVVFQLAP